MKHLKFDVRAYVEIFGINSKHPKKFMDDAGIIYSHAVPQTLGDQWWFFNCEKIPDNVEGCISILDIDNPLDLVGFEVLC